MKTEYKIRFDEKEWADITKTETRITKQGHKHRGTLATMRMPIDQLINLGRIAQQEKERRKATGLWKSYTS